ncbi:hypothetical protein [Niabella aurantiaca]|uniref:hypothetical protein n=1 Tax=Niabella aurantiaca TaxID=379900 RepID=UPI000366417F|nr:hypothetical protein [Niabella aurantiaca]
MKKQVTLLFSVATLLFASCGSDKGDTIDPPKTGTEIVVGQASGSGDPLPSTITANTTWTANNKYLLKGFVYVADGATLTIEPGTVIKGDNKSKGTLIIARGGKIIAQGTADKPIVFTSNFPKGQRKAGDWGGLILLGKAPSNTTADKSKVEGGLTVPTGTTLNEYGGDNPADNSGILKYVRVEFAGVEYSTDNEINGITFGGVGSGTQVSYVQVYRSGDDAIEWFGGTVNADHLVATGTWDDDFDTDNGYSGKVQFAIAQRNPAYRDKSESNGFESDNDGNGSTRTPQTKAVFSNVTIIGPMNGTGNTIHEYFKHGAQIRRNSSLSIVNSVFVGFPIGVYIDDTKGTATSLNYLAGSLMFKNNIIAGCPEPVKTTNPVIKPQIESNNAVLATIAEAKVADAYKFNATPSFLLAAGSPALTGANFDGISGFQAVAYKGAFDQTNDWTKTWTTWNAEQNEY